ncbi:hypothetical protein [Pseudoduganella guangdongensis]|uniref:hypothetical protein n=1 Tax=Pseudoduganella guangdongensis TaxID=2692179 RepID=UPI0019251824|nr:hypothetical protein [Pseudoduganella guangdongensis]
MRKLLTVAPVLLLAGCVNDSATFYADPTREHTLTVRRQQEFFWKEDAQYTLMAARLPDCQRAIPLGEMPLEDLDFELFASGDNVWSLRAGKYVWQVETQGCSLVAEGGNTVASGDKLGTFAIGSKKEKLRFDAEAAPAGATAPAAGQAAEPPAAAGDATAAPPPGQ